MLASSQTDVGARESKSRSEGKEGSGAFGLTAVRRAMVEWSINLGGGVRLCLHFRLISHVCLLPCQVMVKCRIHLRSLQPGSHVTSPSITPISSFSLRNFPSPALISLYLSLPLTYSLILTLTDSRTLHSLLTSLCIHSI